MVCSPQAVHSEGSPEMRLAIRAAVSALALLASGFAFLPAAQTPPTAQSGADLSGIVSLLLPPAVKVDPGGIVIWIPGVSVLSPAASSPSITSKDKRFDPRIIAVTRGAKISFPNVDSIYHNAFSLSPGNAFDAGLYRKGASRATTFNATGIVHIYCNIHPDMVASVVVVDGNAHTVVAAVGSFMVSGVPPGVHEVHIWSDLAGEQKTTLVFRSGGTTEWNPTLDATTYRRVAHTNKQGKPYPKAKNDADRY